MKHLFYGGVHPADKKALSAGAPLQKLEKPKQVIIPMSQHIGAPCNPLVKVGDWVKKGQKIGDGEGLCVPVHASVSGKQKTAKGFSLLAVQFSNSMGVTLELSSYGSQLARTFASGY